MADGADIQNARAIITALDLQPHPEGGWYRETWRSDELRDGRTLATAIHFLLERGQASHWHRVDADELWLWHAGAPLDLHCAEGDDGKVQSVLLGSDILTGQHVQHRIPAGCWQSARASHGWVLVSCIVSPGFDFAGFELAPPDWRPGG